MNDLEMKMIFEIGRNFVLCCVLLSDPPSGGQQVIAQLATLLPFILLGYPLFGGASSLLFFKTPRVASLESVSSVR